MSFSAHEVLIKWFCLGLLFSEGRCLDNLALHKPAWLSSLYHPVNGVAEKAVAGTHEASYYQNACSHTAFGDGSPWLIVDLLGQYNIHNVTIYNRQDCCGENLRNFFIEVFQTNPTRCASARGSLCIHYPGIFGPFGTLSCDQPVLGRFIRVWKPEATVTAGHDETLLICELEVYGTQPECQPSYYIRSLEQRLASSAKTVMVVPSKTSCVMECEMSVSCVGVNYNNGSGACELLTRPEPSESASSDSDWEYYGHDLC